MDLWQFATRVASEFPKERKVGRNQRRNFLRRVLAAVNKSSRSMGGVGIVYIAGPKIHGVWQDRFGNTLPEFEYGVLSGEKVPEAVKTFFGREMVLVVGPHISCVSIFCEHPNDAARADTLLVAEAERRRRCGASPVRLPGRSRCHRGALHREAVDRRPDE